MDAITRQYVGDVIMLADMTAQQAAFARFEGDEESRWLDEKEPQCGKQGTVVEVHPQYKTLTIQFEDEVSYEFPCEAVAKQLTRHCDKVCPETWTEDFIRENLGELELNDISEENTNVLVAKIPLKQYSQPNSMQERQNQQQYLESLGVDKEFAIELETGMARMLRNQDRDCGKWDEIWPDFPEHMENL